MNLSVACGVAVAAAVLSGALLVGDSYARQLAGIDLREAGKDRCGGRAGRFFRAELADELAGEPEFRLHAAAAVPLVLLRASVETAAPGRANQVNLIGCDERFWKLGGRAAARLPGNREIAINQPLAEQLGVRVGQPVILRLPKPAAIPAESALGQKTETVAGWRLTVSEILPAEGLGRFSLRADQREPRNAYVSLAAVQSRLDKPGQANVLLAAGRRRRRRSAGRTGRGIATTPPSDLGRLWTVGRADRPGRLPHRLGPHDPRAGGGTGNRPRRRGLAAVSPLALWEMGRG